MVRVAGVGGLTDRPTVRPTHSSFQFQHPPPHTTTTQEFGVSKQFNPTKAWIDFFAAIGMVSNRKRATGAWAKLKQSKANAAADGKEWKGRGVVQGTPQWPGHEVAAKYM